MDDEERQQRLAWIEASRKALRPGDKQPCVLCGGHAGVTHAHHVAPLGMQYDVGIRDAEQEYLWLCPTHHALVHAAINEALRGEQTAAFDGETIAEHIAECYKIAARGLAVLALAAIMQNVK